MEQYIIQNNFNGGILSKSLTERSDLDVYSKSLKDAVNFYALSSGNLSKRPGTEFIAACKASHDQNVILVPYSPDSVHKYILEFGPFYIRFFFDKAPVFQNGVPFEIETPWDNDEILNLGFAAQNKKLHIVSGSGTPYILSRDSESTEITWSIAPQLLDGPYAIEFETDFKLIWTDGTGESGTDSTITCTHDFFNYDDTGRSIQVFYGNIEDATERMTDSRYHSFLIKSVEEPTSITGTWIRPAINGETDWETSTDSTVCVISVFGNPVNSKNSEWDQFKPDGFPAVISFYEGRLVFGSTYNYPATVYGSNSTKSVSEFVKNGSTFDSFYQFVRKQQNPSDFAYSYTLASSVISKILWFVPTSILGIGTSEEEWRMGVLNSAENTTPNAVAMKRESGYGSFNVQAILFGNKMVFVSASGNQLLAWQFNYKTISFEGESLNLFSEDILKTGVVSLSSSVGLEKRIFATLNNGKLAVLNYMKSQSINGWSIFETEGDFKYCTNIKPAVSGNADNETWVIVKRYNHGGQYLSIEVFEDENFPDRNLKSYADSSLKYDGTFATVFSGLEHLEGNLVSILADGMVKPDQIVENGTITLDKSAVKVVVGLPYDAFIKTLNFIPSYQQSDLTGVKLGMGNKRRIASAKISFYDTLNGWIGIDSDHLNPVLFRSSYDSTLGEMPLFTGIKEESINDSMDTSSSIMISSSTPTPMNIKSIGCSICI